MQTDHLILSRKPDLILIYKNLWSSGFCHSSGTKTENKRNQGAEQIPGFFPRAEIAEEYEGDCNTNNCCYPWNGLHDSGKEIRWTGDLGKNWNNSNPSTVKISKNTQKNPGVLKRLAVTKTSG